jgi:hypothetical protein
MSQRLATEMLPKAANSTELCCHPNCHRIIWDRVAINGTSRDCAPGKRR